MGEAKKRGSLGGRQEEAKARRVQEINGFRVELGMSPEASFLGYVILSVQKDDYLMEITDTKGAIYRQYSKRPEFAMRYPDWETAEKIVKTLPGHCKIGLLFDGGKQWQVGFYKD